jgi:microsomal dipeptidase-like Zn-dependent dipeptidase
MASPSYIDFHCHPGLKTFLSGADEGSRSNCWETPDLVGFLGEVAKIALGNMFNSNSSLTQLKAGNVSIAVVGLYAYERPMITGTLEMRSDTGFNLLKATKLLGKRNRENISRECLEKISSVKNNYFDLFNEVQEHLLDSRDIVPKYKLLKKLSESEPDMLNIILSIEGGHNLLSNLPGDKPDRESVLKNLETLKKMEDRRYLFLGLAHLESTELCNHAYGMKIIADDGFRPAGDGISNLGKDVIKKALEEEPYRMLIDVKHMSFRARMQYYDMLKYGSLKNVPIIMSHAGLTGRSYKEMPIKSYELIDRWYKVEYYQPTGLLGTEFNPWSINLYDEEIPIIIKSNGIIGINLDERILGTGRPTPDHLTEYFSEGEYEFCRPFFEMGKATAESLDNQDNSDEKHGFHRDLRHICNNILRIVKKGGPEAWNNICIGSDFDGLVNPVDNYHTSEKFGKLSKDLEKCLPRMAESDKGYQYDLSNMKAKVEGIMYENARTFLEKYF